MDTTSRQTGLGSLRAKRADRVDPWRGALTVVVVALGAGLGGCESSGGRARAAQPAATRQAAPLVATVQPESEAASAGNPVIEWDGRGAKKIEFGRVVEARPVTIEGSRTGIGALGGAVTGAVVTRPTRATPGQLVVTAAGTVTGAVVGRKYEEVMTRREGQEILVRLDEGPIVTVTQGVEEGYFQTGDVVKIVYSERGGHVTLTNPDEKAAVLAAQERRRREGAWYEAPGAGTPE